MDISNIGNVGQTKNAAGCGIFGVIIGVIFTLGSVGGLFWNEGRAVYRYKTLNEGQGAVVSVENSAIDPANEGKLIHISGTSDVKSGPLKDPVFGVTESGIKLKRKAEMYQWKESKSEKDNRTTYSYSKTWSQSLINSDSFEKLGHNNPKTMAYNSKTFTAEKVDIGAFSVAPFLVEKINNSEDLSVASIAEADAKVQETGKLSDGGVYFGGSAGSPEIGDVRVNFSTVPTGPTSLVAQQRGNSFEIYQAEHGTIALLDESTKSAEVLFTDAHTANKIKTWAIRGGGFLLMAMGIGLVFKPLTALASAIPFLGNIVNAGVGFISMILAGIISFVTIAIAWIFYRPMLGISLLVVAVALLVWMIARISKKKAEAQDGGAYAGSMGTPPPMD